MKKHLDFICIGAAKSGTTTLFELMKNHPMLVMPSEKEVPFFSSDTVYENGLGWYMKTYFSGRQKKNTLLGTITPQYMLGEGAVTSEIVAQRIHKALPSVKLIAILRHPIERAHSHYKMSAQRGHLTESFEKAVETLLDREDLSNLHKSDISIENNFLFGSEYGHELAPYYKLFNSDDILVLYTDELKLSPQETLNKVFAFLGVTPFTPETIGQEFRKGGDSAKIAVLKPGNIYKIPFVKKLWKEYTPYQFRKKVEYSINLWNIKPGKKGLDKNSATYKTLVQYYRDDVKLLESLTKTKVPWADWK